MDGHFLDVLGQGVPGQDDLPLDVLSLVILRVGPRADPDDRGREVGRPAALDEGARGALRRGDEPGHGLDEAELRPAHPGRDLAVEVLQAEELESRPDRHPQDLGGSQAVVAALLPKPLQDLVGLVGAERPVIGRDDGQIVEGGGAVDLAPDEAQPGLRKDRRAPGRPGGPGQDQARAKQADKGESPERSSHGPSISLLKDVRPPAILPGTGDGTTATLSSSYNQMARFLFCAPTRNPLAAEERA